MTIHVGLLYHQPQIIREIEEQLPRCNIIDLSHLAMSSPDQLPCPVDDLIAEIQQCDVLVTSLTTPPLPEQIASQPGRLKYICHTRGMLRPYFSTDLLKNGIRLSNWGDERAWIVADKVMAILLSLIIQLPGLDLLSKTNRETRISIAYPDRIDGFHLGLYGCGAIGKQVAEKAMALGMKVVVYDPFAPVLPNGCQRVETLDELFSTNYAVSLHAANTAQTKGSVNARRLGLLPQGGIIINSARGSLINDNDLVNELKAGRLLAGLDVLSDEDDWTASPYAEFPHCMLTRHGIRLPGYQVPNFTLPDYAVHNIHHFLSDTPLRNEILTVEQFNQTT